MTAATTSKKPDWRASRHARHVVSQVFAYALLLAGSFVFITPLIWMFSTSLRPEWEVYTYPPKLFPNYWVWRNYPEGWSSLIPFSTFLKNTLTITLFNVTGNLISCSLSAFGFARLHSRYRNVLFMLLLSTMMLPYEVTMIPQYVVFAKYLKWGNDFKPLILPAWFGWPFGIFLLRQFFMTIPFELDDAARIDGASTFRIFAQIMLPLVKPAMATIAIFAFVGNWNNFMGPLIYLNSMEKLTVPIALQWFRGQSATQVAYKPTEGLMMAAATVATIPCILLFIVAQRYFVRGVVMSGLKGAGV